jgi:iron complex transport system ATP-binding protein
MDKSRISTVELHSLTLGYGERILFRGAEIGFGWGEFTALIGRNGTGKSTLLRAVAALAKPLDGSITVDGRLIYSLTPREIASKISFVSTDEVRVSNLRVADIVALGRAPYTNWIGNLRNDDRQVVVKALELVGMSDCASKNIDRLSDGERQRVMIARALAQDTPIILLDEPTAFLDLPNKYEIGLLLRRLAHEQGKSIVFSTHDLAVALELCDTIAMIHDGCIYYGTADRLVAEGRLQQLFTGTPLRFDSDELRVRLREQ